MYNEVELWLFPDTDISELRAVPGPKAPGLGEFECSRYHLRNLKKIMTMIF